MKKLIILSSVVALFAYACSNNNEDSNVEPQKQAKTTLNFKIKQDESRSVLNENTSAKITTKWSTGDKVVVFTDAGNKYIFTCPASEAGKVTSSFECSDEIPATETPKYAYYTNDQSGTSIASVPGSVASAQSESRFFSEDFGKFDHKVSNEYNASSRTFTFQQSLAILRYHSKFTDPTISTVLGSIDVDNVTITFPSRQISGTYTMSIPASGALSQSNFSVGTTNSVTYSFDESTTLAANECVAYMFVLPIVQDDDDCTITVEGSGLKVKMDAKVYPYNPGKFYEIVVGDALAKSNKIWVNFGAMEGLLKMAISFKNPGIAALFPTNPIQFYTVDNSAPIDGYYNLDLKNKSASIITYLSMLSPITSIPQNPGSVVSGVPGL